MTPLSLNRSCGLRFQLLLLCFIRKAMDFVFTQRELFWLDHILPEEKRRSDEDEALQNGVEMHYKVRSYVCHRRCNVDAKNRSFRQADQELCNFAHK